MFPERFYRLEDVALMRGQRVVLPGEPEPEWLRRAAANRRALVQLRADRRANRTQARARIAGRLRFVFARRGA